MLQHGKDTLAVIDLLMIIGLLIIGLLMKSVIMFRIKFSCHEVTIGLLVESTQISTKPFGDMKDKYIKGTSEMKHL